MSQECKISEMVNYIKDKLGKERLLCQLAEEASELAQAALKLVRVYDGANPTPVSEKDAYENLREEIADVWLILNFLETNHNFYEYGEMMNKKTERWYNRIKNKRKEN